MSDVLPGAVARFVRAAGPKPDETLQEMDRYASEEGFPHVGPEVGGFLRFLAHATGATRAFEFGSGFGYSAYWIAGALPEDGEVVLTEFDGDLLDRARTYLDRGGYADRARFERGDAVETAAETTEPVDLVLIDHEKTRYVEAFETVEPSIPPGGVVVADNAMSASVIDFESLQAHLDGEDPDLTGETAGIAAYLDLVRSHPDFETVVLPLGEGIAVSYRVE